MSGSFVFKWGATPEQYEDEDLMDMDPPADLLAVLIPPPPLLAQLLSSLALLPVPLAWKSRADLGSATIFQILLHLGPAAVHQGCASF